MDSRNESVSEGTRSLLSLRPAKRSGVHERKRSALEGRLLALPSVHGDSWPVSTHSQVDSRPALERTANREGSLEAGDNPRQTPARRFSPLPQEAAALVLHFLSEQHRSLPARALAEH